MEDTANTMILVLNNYFVQSKERVMSATRKLPPPGEMSDTIGEFKGKKKKPTE